MFLRFADWYLEVEEEKADTRPAVRVEEQRIVISMQGSNKGDAARMLCVGWDN